MDETVSPGETHTYSVVALDGHFNFAPPGTITVTIPTEKLTAIVSIPPATPPATTAPKPPAPPTGPPTRGTTAKIQSPQPHVTAGTPQADSGGGLDPRRIGVRALGSYWGGAGENIDAVSGNLNLTIPLLNPQSRNGTAIPIVLSYNSQIWREDGSNTVTLLGQDTGFGLGWNCKPA